MKLERYLVSIMSNPPCTQCPVLVRCKIKYGYDKDIDCPLVWDYVIIQTHAPADNYLDRRERHRKVLDIFEGAPLRYITDTKTGDAY